MNQETKHSKHGSLSDERMRGQNKLNLPRNSSLLLNTQLMPQMPDYWNLGLRRPTHENNGPNHYEFCGFSQDTN